MPSQPFARLRAGAMLKGPEVVALLDAFKSFAKSTKRDRAAVGRIRPLVCEVVDELKREEWPAERVIVALKTIAREAGLVTTTSLPTTQEITSGDRLLGESVRWCIEHYYRD